MFRIFLKQKYQWRLLFILFILLTFVSFSVAQNRQGNRRLTSKYNVLAVAFSPDGQTLAISRGTEGFSQRHGQIDLWNIETGKIQRVITGFDGPVWSVAFSRDSQTLISGSSEFRSKTLQGDPGKGKHYTEIKWWDVQTGELKFKQTNPTDELKALFTSLSTDGKLLANVEYYTQVHYIYPSMIDASSPLMGETGSLNSSNRLGQSNYSIRTNVINLNLLNAQTGAVNIELKGVLKSSSSFFRSRYFLNSDQTLLFNGPVFSPIDNLVAVGMPDEVKVWDTKTGSMALKLKKFKGHARSIAFSPDGQILAIASLVSGSDNSDKKNANDFKSELNFFEVKTGRFIKKITQEGIIFYLSFINKSGGMLIGAVEYEENKASNSLKYLDVETGNISGIVNKKPDMRSFILSPNEQLVAFRNDKTSVTLWDIKKRQEKFTFEEIKDEKVSQTASRFILDVKKVLAVGFSADGKTIAAGTEDNEIKLWDPRTGAEKKKLAGHEGAVFGVAVSADGKNLVSNDEETIILWDTQTGGQKNILAKDISSITPVASSNDGKTVVGGTDGKLLLWDAESGELKKTLVLSNQNPLIKVIFSSNGQNLLTASETGAIQVWNIETGEIIKSWETNSNLTTISLSPNGQILASATEDGLINIWDVQRGGLIKTLDKHEGAINSLAFSPDGKLLASGGDDRKIFVWDTSNWKSEHTMKGLDMTVTSLAFSPDGQFLASGSGNLSVVLWNVQTGNLDRILK